MAEEIKKLNIYQKIQKARVELQKRDIKKTGLNKYSNYKYFELGDFLPHVNEICDELGLYTEFEYGEEEAFLYLIDSDNPEIKRKWRTPVKVPALKGCTDIQAIGGSQTFCRRYLYMMAFEISETDIVNNAEVDEDKQEGEKKIGTVYLNVIKRLIDETETEITSFLKYAGVESVEDIKNKDYPELIKLLEKKRQDHKKKQENEKRLKEQQDKLQKELESQQGNFEF